MLATLTINSALPLLDIDHLRGISGKPLDRALLRELKELFLAEAGDEMARLERNRGQMSPLQIAERLHFLTGSSSNLGMVRLADYYRQGHQVYRDSEALLSDVYFKNLFDLYRETTSLFDKLLAGEDTEALQQGPSIN